MIEANINNEVLDATRADGAARAARFRARKDLELEGLSVQKMLKLKATRSAALAATVSAAQQCMQQLTPEQREVYDSELFQVGAEDGSSAGLRSLQSHLFDVIEGVRNGEMPIRKYGLEIRADWCAEFYADYIATWPFAKALVYPRSYSGESSYTMAEFFTSVERWLAASNHTDSDFVLPEPEKRKRGRPRVHPLPATTVDPAVAASWSAYKPPQTDRADRLAAAALVKDIEEADLTRST
jgi:hypothetical protein